MEFRVQRPDGSSAWIHGIGRAERDAEGRATRLSGINLDITARKQAETALREVRDQQREDAGTMRLALDAAAAGAWSWDPDTNLVSADPRTCARLGLPPDQPFPPERFETDVHPDDRRVFAIIDSVRGPSGPDGWDFEYRRVGADGRVTWHQSIAHASRDATGRVTRISGISLDITRRKETEAEVAQPYGSPPG
jgi:PAS domain S-box-containing protein